MHWQERWRTCLTAITASPWLRWTMRVSAPPIDDLVQRGVPVVTLVSDVPQSRRIHYVGIDNPAAGRTAGALMGRFLAGQRGAVGLIAGSMALRDHAERHFGFHQVLATEFPHLTVLPPLEGRDDSDRNEALTLELLRERPDLVGLYNIGAGNRGIAGRWNRPAAPAAWSGLPMS